LQTQGVVFAAVESAASKTVHLMMPCEGAGEYGEHLWKTLKVSKMLLPLQAMAVVYPRDAESW
jgi:hypothetical protein